MEKESFDELVANFSGPYGNFVQMRVDKNCIKVSDIAWDMGGDLDNIFFNCLPVMIT